MPNFDPRKNAANVRKHGHDLGSCEEALDDREDGPRLISCRDAKRHEQKAYFRAYPQG
jgi:uncharacterized DUF497 family protein